MTTLPAAPVCSQCRAPLADDQRYCLNCGTRVGQPRVAPGLPVTPPSPLHAPVVATVPAEDRGSLVLLAGVMTLLLALAVGVVIGDAVTGDERGGPPVVTVQQTPAVAATAPAAFTSDWPAGIEAWTVQLRTLPASTDAATVARAKQEAVAAGAPEVGALRSDDFPSLPGGEYVVYSGRHTTDRHADQARRRLLGSFPEARVVRVGTGPAPVSSAGASEPSDTGARSTKTVDQEELEQTSKLSPEEFQKRSKKLPDEVESEGAPPPKDSKPAGGGSDDVTVIE